MHKPLDKDQRAKTMTPETAVVSAHRLSIRLDGVSKRFDYVLAVEDIDLTVAPGEFVSLIGPSGCGKSTTMLMAAGLLPRARAWSASTIRRFTSP